MENPGSVCGEPFRGLDRIPALDRHALAHALTQPDATALEHVERGRDDERLLRHRVSMLTCDHR